MKFLETFTEQFINGNIRRTMSPDAITELDEAIFAYNEFVEENLIDKPSVIDIDAEELIKLSVKDEVSIESEIDLIDDLRVRRAHSNKNLGELIFQANASGGVRVLIKAYTSPNNIEVQRALNEMRAGKSFRLEQAVIRTQLDIVYPGFVKNTLAATFALALAVRRGYADVEEMEYFYKSVKDRQPDYDAYHILIDDATHFVDQNNTLSEREKVTKAYLGAAAIYLMSKEIPLLKTCSVLKPLLELVGPMIEED